MYLEHIYQEELAHSSYIIGSGKQCMVVDPARNIKPYLAIAARRGMEVTGIIQTHLHADFISGHMELAKTTRAKIYAPKSAGCLFAHVPLEDGETFGLDSLRFKIMHTPGHTPECSVYLVSDIKRGKGTQIAFTGDTLLVGDAGRPDLFPDKKEVLAEKLFKSLQRLKKLDDGIEVYPAHGMGSLCGRALSSKLWSTLGNERRYNYTLGYDDPETFKKSLLEGMPETPDHFARCSEENRKGPAVLSDLKRPRPLSPAQALNLIKKGCRVLDTRNNLAFAASHITGAYSIDKDGNLPLFAGWILPPDKNIILLTDNGDCPQYILDALHSVGLDNIAGYIKEGMYAWLTAGLTTAGINVLTPAQLRGSIQKREEIVILDNRLRSEWLRGRIKDSIFMPAPDLRHRYKELNKEITTVTVCGSGTRSMMAASILKQNGFKSVFNLLGGIEAWKNSGYPIETSGGKQ